MANLQSLGTNAAGSLIEMAYLKTNGATKKKISIIVEDMPGTSDEAWFRFYVVQKKRGASLTTVLSKVILKDVVGKLVSHFTPGGDISDAASAMSDHVGNMQGGGQDIYGAENTRICGQLQLGAAKKMGQKQYSNARLYGLIRNRIHSGVVRFNAEQYPIQGLSIRLVTWMPPGDKYVMDGSGSGGKMPSADFLKEFEKKNAGELRGMFVYSAATGEML